MSVEAEAAGSARPRSPSMRILRAADYRRMPWKNGGGETVEIAVFPPAAGLNDFEWRVSMAPVAGDGPFSSFPGIDRTLAVLDGSGIRLAVGDRAATELTPASAPFSFPADVDAAATLIDGPITDLNVMTRRGRFGHRVRALRPPSATELRIDAATVLLFCHDGNATIEAGGSIHRLARFETLRAENVARFWRIVPDGQLRLLLVEIDRV